MSRNTSTFASAIGGSLVALCVLLAGTGFGTATLSSDDGPETPPTTTVPVTTEGNPWHG